MIAATPATADFETSVSDACDALSVRLEPGKAPVIAVSTVNDEQDVIESFVRHSLGSVDGLLIVNHRSSDETGAILQSLAAEGLPLAVINWRNPGQHQAERLTLLGSAAAHRLNARTIVPMDADEFLVAPKDQSSARQLRVVPIDAVRVLEWLSYVPVGDDELNEQDVIRRIVHRRRREVTHIRKVVVGGEVARQAQFRIDSGSHSALVGTDKVTEIPYDGQLSIAHFPVRSISQIVAKVAVARLALQLVFERPSDAGVHYEWLHSLVPIGLQMTNDELTQAAALYNCRIFEDVELVRDPVQPNYTFPLRYSCGLPADPVQRLASLGQDLVDQLLKSRTIDNDGRGMERLIAVENETLRAAVTSAEQREKDLRRAVANLLLVRFSQLVNAEEQPAALLARLASLAERRNLWRWIVDWARPVRHLGREPRNRN